MKIVFTTKGKEMDSMMDARFGRAGYLLMYDDDTQQHIVYDNSESGNAAHGAGPLTAQKVYELKADVIITGNGPGDNATATLQMANIKVYVGAGNMTVSEALLAFQQAKLTEIKL